VARDRLAVLLLATGLALSGCGGDDESGGEMKRIDWDLSKSHTTADVDWPNPDLEATEISPVGSVRIRMPGGQAFSAGDGVVHDVTLERRGDEVITVQIDSHPRTHADAYDLAVEWAKPWGVPTKPLDDWRRGVDSDGDPTVEAIAPDAPVGGPDGPEPTVQIRKSFDDERPSLVSLQFLWPGLAGR
jgi:hypothetical protein